MSIFIGHTSRSIGIPFLLATPYFSYLGTWWQQPRLTVTQFSDGAGKSNPSTVDG